MSPKILFALRKIGVLSVLICATASVKAQSKPVVVNPDSVVFVAVQSSPKFPGGMEAFYKFISANVRYPKEAHDKKQQGRVYVSFIVETNGTLSSFKLLRGAGYGMDEEALRVLAASPNWTAGEQNGRKVRVQYTVPIEFKLTANQ